MPDTYTVRAGGSFYKSLAVGYHKTVEILFIFPGINILGYIHGKRINPVNLTVNGNGNGISGTAEEIQIYKTDNRRKNYGGNQNYIISQAVFFYIILVMHISREDLHC